MSWICSLAGQVKPPTIKAYLCHVRSMHTDADIPFTVCDSPMVQRLFRGIKRFHGDPDRAPKSPITLPVLLAMLDTLQPGVVAGHDQLYASWCLAFAAFLRSGEFTLKRGKFHRQTCLSRDSVEFLPSLENPDRVILTLPASKTDPFRKGIRITVAAAPGHRSCAVAALKRLFEAQPRSGSAPLFEGLDGDAMRYDYLVKSVRTALLSAGINPANFAGHSFRRGAASQAAAGGPLAQRCLQAVHRHGYSPAPSCLQTPSYGPSTHRSSRSSGTLKLSHYGLGLALLEDRPEGFRSTNYLSPKHSSPSFNIPLPTSLSLSSSRSETSDGPCERSGERIRHLTPLPRSTLLAGLGLALLEDRPEGFRSTNYLSPKHSSPSFNIPLPTSLSLSSSRSETIITHHISPTRLTQLLVALMHETDTIYIRAVEAGLSPSDVDPAEALSKLQIKVSELHEESLRNSLSTWKMLAEFLQGRSLVLYQCIRDVQDLKTRIEISKEEQLRNLNPTGDGRAAAWAMSARRRHIHPSGTRCHCRSLDLF
ncbi:hypothetical protein C8J57DRAFT_1474228 [Mycena rebaudengoi]|nr:hypothetical protein C8J57DRAFT_1474228 [Mycena rebaudengoi]